MIRLSDDERRNPYPVYDRARAGGSVLHEPRADAWIVLGYDGVKRALTDHDAFSSRASTSGGQEARIVLSEFLRRVTDFVPVGDAPWEPRKAFHVHGPARLPIRVTPVA